MACGGDVENEGKGANCTVRHGPPGPSTVTLPKPILPYNPNP